MAKKMTITELTNDKILALAIYKVSGEYGNCDAEDIAVTADQLVKGKYRWKKYKKYIDLSLVKTLLANSRDRAKMIDGGDKDGWKLSSKGIKVVNDIKDKISYSGQRLERLSKFDKSKIEFEIDRISNSPALSCYINNKSIDKNDISKIFKIDEYATTEVIEKNSFMLIRLMRGRNEIIKFLKHIRSEIINNE